MGGTCMISAANLPREWGLRQAGDTQPVRRDALDTNVPPLPRRALARLSFKK